MKRIEVSTEHDGSKPSTKTEPAVGKCTYFYM